MKLLQASLINFEITTPTAHHTKCRKGVPQTAVISQMYMYFLKISKPAGIWWGTPYVGNSS